VKVLKTLMALSWVVVIVGAVVLGLGVVLLVQGGSAKSKVIDGVLADKGVPMTLIDGKLTPAKGSLDNIAAIADTAEALKLQRWAISKPNTPGNQDQVNLMAAQIGLNLAQGNYGLGQAMQVIGVISLLAGFATIVVGFGTFVFSKGFAQMAAMFAPSPEPKRKTEAAAVATA
jgi:hypothetical protein